MAGLEAWLRHLSAFAVAGAVAAACGGTDFSAADDPAAGEGGEGAGGAAGSKAQGGSSTSGGSGSTVLCENADDCDDRNPCSVDFCNELGVCEHPPKCGGAEPRCCENGECGQCCNDDDCPTLNDCMKALCVQGFCTNTPGTCEDPNEYCGLDGCVPKEPCETASDCDDGNPCTAEECDDGLCSYSGCGEELRCCPGGCAECCSDSQCGGAAESPCKVSKCEQGSCTTADLCEPGELCCPNAAGTAAFCGECCDASTCPDDDIACTLKTCRSGVCGNTPDNARCEAGAVCNPELGGCTSGGQCDGPEDCGNPGACKTAECKGGECHFDDVSCSNGERCCPEGPLAGACHGCCSNSDCQSSSGEDGLVNCCQDDGQCHECCSNSDCEGVVLPFASGGGAGVPMPCRVATCDPLTRRCQPALPCPKGETCCPNGLCSGPNGLCISAD